MQPVDAEATEQPAAQAFLTDAIGGNDDVRDNDDDQSGANEDDRSDDGDDDDAEGDDGDEDAGDDDDAQ